MITSTIINKFCKGCNTEAQVRYSTNGDDVFSDCLNCEAILIEEMKFTESEKNKEELNQAEAV